MRRVQRLFLPLAFALAWIVAFAGVTCVVLEQSGWIADSVRGRVTRALPGLDVDFEDVRVLWLRPGLILEDVTVSAEGGYVAFDSVLVELAPWARRSELLRGVEVRGGRARISEGLELALRRALQPETGVGAARPREEPVPMPRVTVTDFRVELELPSGQVLPLGQIDLRVEDEGGDAYIAGRLLELPGTAGSSAVHLAGTVHQSGLVDVEASGIELAVDSARLPAFWDDRPEVIERARGVVTLVARGSLHLRGEGPTRVEGRLELRDGSIETSIATTPVVDVRSRVDLAWAPEPEHRLWTTEAWDGRARLSASWNEQVVDAKARVGRSAGGEAVRAWATIAGMELDEERREGLVLDPAFERFLGTLDLAGTADVCAALSIPTLDVSEGAAVEASALLDLRPRADAVVSYLGFPDVGGERWGIPIPVHVQSGRILWALAASLPRPQRVGLVGLVGDHGSGQVKLDGTIASPLAGAPPGTPPREDIELRIPSIALDDTAARGLAGMPATRALFEEYGLGAPGTLSGRWHFHSSREVGGLTAQGDMTFAVERLAWKPLPVPLEDVEGRIGLRWSARATPIVWGGPYPRRWRAHGVHVSGSGELPSGGAFVLGVVHRTETLEAESITPEEIPRGGGTDAHVLRVQGLDVQSEEFDLLTEAQPVVGEVARPLGARGAVDLVYRGRTEGPGEPYRFDVDVVPRELELQPERLGLPVTGVAGRVIATGVREEALDAESPPEYDVTVRGAFEGRARVESRLAPTEFHLAGTVARRPRAPLALALAAAGVPPDARPVRRALAAAIALPAVGPAGPRSDATRITGRLDADLEVSFLPDTIAPPAVSARIDLRRNSLVTERFRLDEAHGAIECADSVLRADRVRAALAGNPVELVDLRVYSSADAGELDDADPLLGQRGFLPDAAVPVLQAGLRARDLPLEEELLSLFLDSETVGVLAHKADLQGRMDLLDTRLVLFSDDRGGLKVGIHGAVVPHNTAVRVGLPVQVSSGRLDIDELLIEPDGTRGRAHVSDLFAHVAGRSLERASMIVSLVESRFSVDDLEGALEGGTLAALGGSGGEPALSIDLKEPWFFTTAVQLAGVDANALLEGLFETSVADKGVVDGWVRLSGSPNDVLGLRGMGRLQLHEARLWSIPVLRALFSRLSFDGTALFDEMDASLLLSGGVLSMTRVDARSPILHLVGSGTVDLDGRLHHDLEVKYALVNRLGPLKVLLYWIQNSILRVAIRGTMWRPEVTLRNVFRDFFRGPPQGHASLPLPGFSPLPQRF